MAAQQPQRSGRRSATAGQSTHSNYNASDIALDNFMQWCDENGVIAPALILYQWLRTNAPHKSYSNKSLAVMLKDDCVHVEIHATGEKFNFFDNCRTTSSQRQIEIKQRNRLKRQAEEQQRVANAKGAQETTKRWHEATQAPIAGYFASKGLTCTHRARWHAQLNCWLIGLYDVHGKLWNLQRIWNDGNKRFMKGGRITGCFALLGQLDSSTRQVLICEGFATGGSLRDETGRTVACAMNAGNLKPVCEAIRAAYPDISIIVCGDDDRAAPVNVGRQKANAAAASVNGKVAFPTFCESCLCGASDFNDAIQCEKQEAAR